MSRSASLERLVEAVRTEVSHLTIEVGNIRNTLQGVQERLSDLEGRTPDTTFKVVSEPVAEDRGAGYRVGAEREAAAKDIGKWIRRCLDGVARGLSGRERVTARSRFYLVVQDFHGRRHDPPLVFESWARCAESVACHGQPGDSIFIGLPSKEECRIALREAGLSLPASLRR